MLLRIFGAREEDLEIDLRIVPLDLFQLLHRRVMDGDVGRALGLFDREAQYLLAADFREVALFGIAVGDLCDVRQADRPAVADRDARLAKLEGVGRVAEHANRLFGARDLGPAARGVDVHLA